MRLTTTFSILSLVSASLAGVLHLDLYTESGDESPTFNHNHEQKALVPLANDAPNWKKRDGGHLVPLVPGAKTGALPTEVEEGLTFALGPRFANEFIQAALGEGNDTSPAVASCNPLKCAGTVIKATPCIVAAIACKCPAPILACPSVKLGDLCSCVGCLPKALRDSLGKLGICNNNMMDMPRPLAKENAPSEYPEYVSFSTRDANFLAFRGDISKSTLAEATEVAAAGFCPGVQCGSCNCCLGVCVFGTCVGSCLPFGSNQSPARNEL